LTFFDNAWDYHDGGSEAIMGKGLAIDNKRTKVFLMTKNCARDAKGTRQHPYGQNIQPNCKQRSSLNLRPPVHE